MSFAEAAGPALIGPDEFTWRPRLRADLDNMRAAVRWSLDAPDVECGELAVRIAAALAPYALFEAAGDIAAIIRQVVPRASSSPPARRAAVLGAAAFDTFQNGGDVERAIELADRRAPRWHGPRMSRARRCLPDTRDLPCPRRP